MHERVYVLIYIYHVFLWYTRVCTPLHCIDMYLFMIVCIYRYFIYVPRRQAVAVATVWLPAALGVVIVTTSGAADNHRVDAMAV